MNNFKAIKYSSNYKSLWDLFVAESINSSFLFKRDYMEYHQDRFEDFSILIFDKKDILVAILPANIVDETVYSHQGLTYGGIVIKSDCHFMNYVEIVKTLLKFLNSKKIKQLFIKILPSIYNQRFSEELSSVLFTLKAVSTKKEISLATTFSKNFKISKRRKGVVNTGIKNGIKILESESLDAFWNNILIPNLKEKYGICPTHSLEEISFLKSKFPKNIRHFVIYFENNLIGGAVIFETKQVANLQYISGLKKFNHLCGSDFLIYELITKIFKHKKYFNFGTSTYNEKGQINKGLFHWKQRFCAKPVVHETVLIKTKNFKKLETLFL